MHTSPTHFNRYAPPTRRSFWPRRVLVEETQHAVLIRHGRASRALEPGPHWIRPRIDRVWFEAATDQVITVPGQEMLTSDGAGVRATLAVTVAVTDPMQVARQGGWHEQLYLATQLAVRNAIAQMTLEQTLLTRTTIDEQLAAELSPVAARLGLTLRAAAVRDFIVPGELKRAVAEVVAARLSGQASLERARSESAALRTLANAARAVADNPALLQLRLIQQMETATGNTYVLDVAPTQGSVR